MPSLPEPGSFRWRLRHNGRYVKQLADHQPEVHRAFWAMHDAAMAPGALDQKTKELIGLALVVAGRCDACIALHLRDALRAGATREEIYETLNVTLMQGDGPTMVAAGDAVEALEEYLAGRDPTDGATRERHAPHRH